MMKESEKPGWSEKRSKDRMAEQRETEKELRKTERDELFCIKKNISV